MATPVTGVIRCKHRAHAHAQPAAVWRLGGKAADYDESKRRDTSLIHPLA
jgi:hypothetical protein